MHGMAGSAGGRREFRSGLVILEILAVGAGPEAIHLIRARGGLKTLHILGIRMAMPTEAGDVRRGSTLRKPSSMACASRNSTVFGLPP